MGWEDELKYLLRRKSRTITYRDPNRVNYRLDDYIGAESDYYGFRAAILYFQLSTQVEINNLIRSVRIIDEYLGPERGVRYATLFLNSSNGTLLHPRGMLSSREQVAWIIRQYYTEYAELNEPYAVVLRQLFPLISIYEEDSYPTHEDICVMFHDERGIQFDNEIAERAKKLKNWISVFVQTGSDIKVTGI